MLFSKEENNELLKIAFLKANSAMRRYNHVEHIAYADISYLSGDNPLMHVKPLLYVNPDTKECLFEIKSLNNGSKFYIIDDYEAMFKQDRSAINLLIQNGLFEEDNSGNILFISKAERKAKKI